MYGGEFERLFVLRARVCVYAHLLAAATAPSLCMAAILDNLLVWLACVCGYAQLLAAAAAAAPGLCMVASLKGF